MTSLLIFGGFYAILLFFDTFLKVILLLQTLRTQTKTMLFYFADLCPLSLRTIYEKYRI